MDSLENVIFTELIPNGLLAVGWNTFWFYVELLRNPRFLNNGLTFQSLYKLYKNCDPLVV